MKNQILFRLLFIALLLGLNPSSFAEEAAPKKEATVFEFPILEIPFGASNGFATIPSMRQSVAFANANDSFLENMIESANFKSRFVKGLVSGLTLYFDGYMPLGSSWMHEEWHRAVMSNRQMGSYNTINDFPFFKTLIPVNRVSDQDLVALKANHPAELVRLEAAGMESQIYKNTELSSKLFFKENLTYREPMTYKTLVMLINSFSVSAYLATCSNATADTQTAEQNQSDGASIPSRDFAGLDCTAWVYDLYRYNQPYANRGIHPSGIGYNRYIAYSMLTPTEKSFLSQQANLSLLNFVDPQLYGFRQFHSSYHGQDFLWNAKLSHYIASFGGVVDLNLFLKIADEKYMVQIHDGYTPNLIFPGLTLKRLDQSTFWQSWKMTSALTLWPQPQGQRYDSVSTDLLVDASFELEYEHSQSSHYFWGVEVKNQGWIAGNVSLDSNVSTWVGWKLIL